MPTSWPAVQVTAVGMFAGGGGFAVAPPTLASLLVVVDGAPATRLGADLPRRMEHPATDLGI